MGVRKKKNRGDSERRNFVPVGYGEPGGESCLGQLIGMGVGETYVAAKGEEIGKESSKGKRGFGAHKCENGGRRAIVGGGWGDVPGERGRWVPITRWGISEEGRNEQQPGTRIERESHGTN